MDSAPPEFPTSPRQLADHTLLAHRRSQLTLPHHAPLQAHLQDLRTRVAPRGLDIPELDPAGGGVNSRILCLLEAPGPQAAQSRGGSGFISMDNDDHTAHTMFQLIADSGVRREQLLLWNIVPWYVGDDHRIRGVKQGEIQEGADLLAELIELLPELAVVVTLGRAAASGWARVKGGDVSRMVTLGSWHPSGQALNGHPERYEHLLMTLRLAQQISEYRQSPFRPSWSF